MARSSARTGQSGGNLRMAQFMYSRTLPSEDVVCILDRPQTEHVAIDVKAKPRSEDFITEKVGVMGKTPGFAMTNDAVFR